MILDISTIFLIQALIAFVNAFFITFAWHGAKVMRPILGVWSLSQILLALFGLLIALRSILPDFLTIIVANTFAVASQVLIQEGIFRYVGKTDYFRKATCGILVVQVVLFLFFTYIHPDIASRILVYAMSMVLICLLTLFGLFSRDKAFETPLIFFAGLLFFHIGVMVYRSVIALTQGYYADFLQSGFLQAVGLLGNIIYSASLVICFFWLIAYRMRVKNQQAEENLQASKDELEKLNNELRIAAMMDGLTHIPNRRYFDEQYIRLWNDAMRHGKPLAVIMADIDLFKAYNDEYGHQAGDDCLKKVAHTFQTASKRATDFVARYGGEEFIVILPDTDGNGSEKFAERLRTNVQELNIPHTQSPVGNVTISIGIAHTMPIKERDSMYLVNAADKALYDAKRAGRNCIRQAAAL